MSAGEVHEGGCLCGAVRYRARGRPTQVNHCHCRMCQRASGAPIVTWATFPSANVEWIKGAPATRRSSDTAERGFCSACGSALFWRGDAEKDLIDLTAGTFDRPETLRPEDHIWIESAMPWLHVADELPRYPRSRKK
jgi:hypothetical protein